MNFVRAGSAFLVVVLTGCGGSMAKPEPIVLSPPRDTVLTSYVGVTRAVWLSRDRWAVLSPDDAAVGLVDFSTDSVARLGGGRAAVLRNPATIFTTGDTLYVGDWGLRQITSWTPEGQLIRSIPTTEIVQGALPRERDAAGHFYVELAPFGQATRQDSSVVVRTGVNLGRGDTVARLSPLDVAEVLGTQDRHFEQRVFSGVDEWGVSAGGSVWVARVNHNRVDWRTPDGQWVKGQPLPDRVLEVTRYDREMFIRNFPPELRSTARQLPFAPIKPPFTDAFNTAGGTVWLVKSRAPADSAGWYHVVGRGGQLLGDLRVPGRGRVIGANTNTAIVAESTRKGVRLLRFALPAMGDYR